eukprot:14592041-Alexandrium_andersonii.AAC.1
MSASLVGSEMCIRDRHSSDDLKLPVSEQVRAFETAPEMGREAFQKLSQPVSYTHLTLPTICSV